MKISRVKIDTLKAVAEGQQSINDFLSCLDRLQEDGKKITIDFENNEVKTIFLDFAYTKQLLRVDE